MSNTTKQQEKKGFNVSLDPSRHLCKVTLWGVWGVKDAKSFGRHLKRKIKNLKGEEKGWYILLDVTASPPQSKDVLRIIDRILATLSRPRVAVLASHTTPLFQPESRSQKAVRRIYSYFWSSEEKAIRWLLEQERGSSEK